MAEVSNVKAIRDYFFPNEGASKAAAQYKALTDEDKAQLGEAIRSGSLNY